ncbi:MAG: hypothetical protein ACPGJF_16615 [Sinimarinibacterium flocculans]|uniref:hypothetical protein n=1 Tax=Sinimarinibacterium flocculans TaxID=985250 RepID=UPI003C55FED0
MSMPRRMPRLGPPTRHAETGLRREPRMPNDCTPIAARGPKLRTPDTGSSSR